MIMNQSSVLQNDWKQSKANSPKFLICTIPSIQNDIRIDTKWQQDEIGLNKIHNLQSGYLGQ